jgi:GT2 family glycosyltransferase
VTRIAVVVLTCDRPGELSVMLRDLAKQSRGVSQLVVVNNARLEQPTRDVVEEFGRRASPELIYLRGTPVFGTASGRNAALREAVGDVVFLLDDDLRFPTRDYLDRVCRVFENDRSGLIGAVTTSAGPVTPLGFGGRTRLQARRIVKRLFDLEARQGGITRSGFQGGFPSLGDGDVDLFQGGVSAIRREVAKSLKFDEDLERRPFAMSEDIEFGLQIRQRWRIRLLGDVIAVNGHARPGRTGAWLDASERYELMVRNHDVINRRHRPGMINRIAFWWAMVGIGIERLAALTVRQRDAGWAWRGYRRGIRAVLMRDRGIDRTVRTVERVVLGR